MRILRLELRKTNICPYCIAAAAIFLCLLGLSFLFAYVPKLESGSQNSAVHIAMAANTHTTAIKNFLCFRRSDNFIIKCPFFQVERAAARIPNRMLDFR